MCLFIYLFAFTFVLLILIVCVQEKVLSLLETLVKKKKIIIIVDVSHLFLL